MLLQEKKREREEKFPLTGRENHDGDNDEGNDGGDNEKCNADSFPIFIFIFNHEIL